MGVSFGLVMLIFGYLVLCCAVQGLIVWGLVTALPLAGEDHPGLAGRVGRLSGQWLLIGGLSFAMGVLAGPLPLR